MAMTESSRVLIYGNDPVLLQTRRTLLLKAGFEVWETMDVEEIGPILSLHDVHVIVLCHSLTEEQCKGVFEITRPYEGRMKRLVLAATTYCWTAEVGDEILSIFEGPQALIDKVRTMKESYLPERVSVPVACPAV